MNLYCDGGVIGRNPSPYGGTWAWCLVKDDEIVKADSGLIYGKITNNVAELHAAISALITISGFNDTLFTDSEITKNRLTKTATPLIGVPLYLVVLVRKLRQTLRCKVKLLAGHPTKADLERGYKIKQLRFGKKRVPVSKWNVWCDNECKRHAREFMEKHNGQGR